MQNLTALRELIQDIARNGQNYTPAVFAQKMMQADVILADYEALTARLVTLPAVVVEDDSAVEIARVFVVQGAGLAGVRWMDSGERFWGSAALAMAAAVGGCAEVRLGADKNDITEGILNSAIDQFEEGTNPAEQHDPSSFKKLN